MTIESSLYERLGGSASIEQVTESFYRKVLADEMLAPYFKDVDLRRLTAMQVAFLTLAFGGPDTYSGRSLRQAHARLGLDDQHFDKVVGYLAETLREAGAGDAEISAVAAIAQTVRADVLNR